MDDSGWVSVRCLFRTRSENLNVYEERITLWKAVSSDEAIALADQDAREYALILSEGSGSTTEFLGLLQAYVIPDSPENGSEIFSLIRQSSLDPSSYIDSFFDTGSENQNKNGGVTR